jgi:hypothetical protein
VEQTAWPVNKERKEAEREWLTTKMEDDLQKIKEKRATAEVNTDDTEELSPRKEAPIDTKWQKPGEFEPQPGSAVIVDDIIIFAHTASVLLAYFICMIEILQHH